MSSASPATAHNDPPVTTGDGRRLSALEGETLARIARELAHAEGDCSTTFELLTDGAIALLGVEGAMVATIAEGEFRVEHASGVLTPFQRFSGPIAERSFANQAITGRRSIVSNDPRDPRMDPRFASRVPVRNLAVAPLLADDVVAGYVLVANRDLPFDVLDAEFLERLADLGALAIRNSRLFAAARRTAAEMRAIGEIVHELNTSLELVRVFELIARHAAELMHARGARVTIVEGNELRLVAQYGDGDKRPIGTVYSMVGTISGEVVASRQPLRIANVGVEAHRWPESVAQLEDASRSVLAVPLFVGERCIGTLVVFATVGQLFSVDDERTLIALGDHAALAIENARLYREAEHEKVVAEVGGAIARVALLGLRPIPLADRIVTLLAPIAGTSRVGIARRTEGNEGLQLLSPSAVAPLPVEGSALRDVLEHAHTVMLDGDADILLGGGAWVLPLIARQRVIGVLAAACADRTVLAESVRRRLLRVSDAVALALDASLQGEQRARDLIEERRLTEQVQQSEKMAALGELVAGVAHELNNPLTGISAFAQLLLEDELSADHRESVNLIKREADRAVSVIRDLNLFARKSGPRMVPVDLNSLLEFTLRLRAYTLRSASVEVTTDLEPDLPKITGDDGKLQQVLLNLVINAEHAMVSSDVRRLVLRTAHTEERLVVTVQDTGTGMTEDVRRHIFEPFFTTKAEGSGTGLGLSVSYGIVKAHGGTLTVETQPGSGSTFRITLPLSP